MKDCSKKLNKKAHFEGDFSVVQVHKKTVENQNITFSINPEDETISGHSGCNQFSLKYSLDNSNVLFNELVSTKKYCPILEIKEKVLFDCFSNSTSYRFENDTIILLNKLEDVLLKAHFVEEN